MNREEAADELGISVRSLQRAVKAGKLTVIYKRGESGKQEASFKPDEIARYKQEMAAETIKPAVTTPEPTTSDRALARIDAPEFFNVLKRFIADGAGKATNNAHPQVAIENKPLLKLNEASTLTGLSRQILRSAINTEQLKAKMVGRAWRIKRADLDLFIKKL
jgi:excisionase family DNA binding protein